MVPTIISLLPAIVKETKFISYFYYLSTWLEFDLLMRKGEAVVMFNWFNIVTIQTFP